MINVIQKKSKGNNLVEDFKVIYEFKNINQRLSGKNHSHSIVAGGLELTS